ncbi:MAG: carboxypeptidase regulatory-like domain-containing protein, partial [Mucilaginibacter sp.]
MKIIAGYLLTVVLAVTCTSTFAQAISSSIQGKVHSDRGMPVDSATVVLLNSRDSSVVRSVVTAKSGVFVFNQLQAGTYLVFITKLNYTKTYSGPCQLIAEQNLDIGFITIKLKARELDGVAITGKKDFVELKPDKTVLNLDQNIMATGSSLYDVLSTAPGVRVLNDDILYRGGQKALIAINGKPVLLSGEELANFLRNYQSSSISQIELIDNPPAKYEASGSGGMINIVLKKNKDVGSSASVSQSAAYGDKYKFNTSLNYNLRTNKLNFFANYNFTGNRAPHTILNNRNILSNGQLYNFDLNYNAQITSHNNSFNVGADYQLTPRQTIGFLFNGYDVNSTIGKKSNTNISTNGQPDSSINTLSTINRDIYNLNYNLNYKA